MLTPFLNNLRAIGHMKHLIAALAVFLGISVSLPCVASAATESEKSFTDRYKKALEAKDEATLKSFLYTKGADPMALEFFTMMVTADMGQTVESVELRNLTPEETKKASAEMPSPTGGMSKLPLTPTKKLVVKTKMADANGSGTSSSETFIAESDGKFVIPVPVAVK